MTSPERDNRSEIALKQLTKKHQPQTLSKPSSQPAMTDVKKQQHTKRSFPPNSKHIHPHPHLDSPAYDASEEDNDPLTDDAASAVSVHISSSRNRDKTGSVNASSNARNALQTGASRPSQARHALASSLVSSDDGVDSPTYDGDIESSTTAAGPHLDPTYRTTTSSSHHYAASIASTLSPSTPPSTLPHVKSVQRPTPAHPSLPTEPAPAMPIPLHSAKASDLVQVVNPNNPSELIASYPLDPLAATLLAPNTPNTFNPANLTPEDIQAHFIEQIDGEGIAVGVGEERTFYKINEPAKGRPVRIYADGVYDLFHFGHALQLRQAKLAFPNISVAPAGPSTPTPVLQHLDSSVSSLSSLPPVLSQQSSASSISSPPSTQPDRPHPRQHQSQQSITSLGSLTQTQVIPGVYLLVGVNSDLQCAQHKSRTVMTHAERCESVRHCRWVDEVVPEAPWVITEEFLHKYQIDYVAHDQDPYGSAGHDDVYAYCKMQGKFLPTLRTPGISTSDLLARLVSGYRHRIWDKKLEKMGLRDLMAEGSDWDESRVGSRRGSRGGSREPSPTRSPGSNGSEKGEKAT